MNRRDVYKKYQGMLYGMRTNLDYRKIVMEQYQDLGIGAFTDLPGVFFKLVPQARGKDYYVSIKSENGEKIVLLSDLDAQDQASLLDCAQRGKIFEKQHYSAPKEVYELRGQHE